MKWTEFGIFTGHTGQAEHDAEIQNMYLQCEKVYQFWQR